MAKTFERDEARRLRRERGLSINQIATDLGVAKSSVSVWVRDVQLSPEQRRQLQTQGGSNEGTRRLAHAMLQKRIGWQNEGRRAARRSEALHAAGTMLYWGEGTKRSNRNSVRIANGDLRLLQLFVRFLRHYFDLTPSELRVSCAFHSANGFDEAEVARYWLEGLDLPVTSLNPPRIDLRPRSSSQAGAGRLPYGVCHLVVNRTDIIQHIYGAIQEYGGFEHPDWVM